MASKRPWMPFYVADWQSSPDIRMMTFEERGVYFELLLTAWSTEDGGIPDNDETLDRLIGQNGAWARVRSSVRRKFEVRNGRLYNPRLCLEIARSKDISEKRSEAAQKRYAKADAIAPAKAPAIADTLHTSHFTDHTTDLTPTPQKRTPLSALPTFTEGFLLFWEEYPPRRKTKKTKTFDLWKKKGLEQKVDEVMKGLRHCKASADWQKNNGEFVPAPEVWIRNDGMYDEMEPANGRVNGHRPRVVEQFGQRVELG